MTETKIEIHLNIYMEVVSPKMTNLLDEVDKVGEVVIYIRNMDYTYNRVMDIINYGTHVKIVEYYRSQIGEVSVERVLHNVKPSAVLRLLFPNSFK